MFGAATEELTHVSMPSDHASIEDWQAFRRDALAAIGELSARRAELRNQIIEESALLRQELRLDRRPRQDGLKYVNLSKVSPQTAVWMLIAVQALSLVVFAIYIFTLVMGRSG
jgi:hypothetical protein